MNKIKDVTIIGTGYVGLTTGVCLASLGHNVNCVDTDTAKIELLRSGVTPILEPGLAELLKTCVEAGRLHFTTSARKAVSSSRIVIMCVPTPQRDDGTADLSYLMDAVVAVKDYVADGAIIVNKSTVPVGTSELVFQALGRDDVSVVSNPEFLAEGTAVDDFLHPSRIVIGSVQPESTQAVAALYDRIDAPKMLVDARTAELIKYASNAFLATKISLANAIGNLSEELGANAMHVLAGVGADERIGPKFLSPGPGWGGSCFPKDSVALIAMAEATGYKLDLLKAVIQSNATQVDRMIDLAATLLHGKTKGSNIAVWGLSFKANTDDTRQSPSLRVIEKLVENGAHITAYDPAVITFKQSNVDMAASALDATESADLLIVLTDWSEFKLVDPIKVASRMAHARVLDTRHLIDADAYTNAGFAAYVVGIGLIAE